MSTNELFGIVKDVLQCSVCLERLKTPKRLRCGHIFCQTCLLRLNQKTCPKCRSSFSMDELKTDLVVGKLLECSGHRHPCKNCTSIFASQCSHCESEFCQSCMLSHLKGSLNLKREIIGENVKREGRSTWVGIGEELRHKLEESIESARRKALVHLNTYYDEIKRTWQMRLDDLVEDAEIDILEAISQTKSHEKPKTCLETRTVASELLVENEDMDKVLHVIEELQTEMDETLEELVAMQWNLSDKTSGSLGRLKNYLGAENVKEYWGGEESAGEREIETCILSKPKSSTPSRAITATRTSGFVLGGTSTSVSASGTFRFPKSEEMFGNRVSRWFGTVPTPYIPFSQSATVPVKESTEMEDSVSTPEENIVGLKSDNLTFEERRIPYWEKTEARLNRNAGDRVRPPCICLYTHKKTGLLNTPSLQFWMETEEKKLEPTSFPGKPLQPGDEDESSPFFRRVDDGSEITELSVDTEPSSDQDEVEAGNQDELSKSE